MKKILIMHNNSKREVKKIIIFSILDVKIEKITTKIE